MEMKDVVTACGNAITLSGTGLKGGYKAPDLTVLEIDFK